MKATRRAYKSAFLPILAAFLAFLPIAAAAQRVQDLPARPTDYVTDFAHVLSPETIERLDSICAQLDHSAANAQVAVVIVRSLEGEDAAEYADELESKWKMGRKGSDRGVLILLAIGDHQRRIEVGYGLEGILNDAKLGDIGRAMVPDLRANDFDGAVTLAVGEIAQDIAADAHVTLDQNALESPAAEQPVRPHSSALGKLILLIIVLVFFGGFSLLRMLLGWGLFFGGWGGGGGGWGGGGFGGGGGSGGGFGGFGGGSFGGGGAGGSW
ncbi:MAG TPA: TPM domain-containing protein [Terracidiphilus sp.]|jgi:uncharacterized protein